MSMNHTISFVSTLALVLSACGGPLESDAESGQSQLPLSDDAVSECYLQAEQAYPGLDVSVKVGSQVVVRSSKLAPVMNGVAAKYTAGNLAVQYNAPGRLALKSAMACILDAGQLTLSTVVLNQRFTDLSIRPATMAELDDQGAIIGNLAFTQVGTTCADEPGLVFQSATSSVAFPVQANGSSDLSGALGIKNVCNKGPISPCTGSCIKDKTKSFFTCKCSGGSGSCAAGMKKFDEGVGGIATVQGL
jgi:hypothetical protein